MSDVNVGGIRANIGLDMSDFQSGYKLFLKGMADIPKRGNEELKKLDDSVQASLGGIRQALSSFSPGGFAAKFAEMGKQVQTALAQAKNEVQSFVKANKDALESVQSLGTKLSLASAALAAPLGLATKGAIDLDRTLRTANTALKLTDQQIRQLGPELSKMAVQLKAGQTSQQLGDALQGIASAGNDASTSLEIMKLAAVGAKAGATNTQVVADGLGKSLNGMGVEADQVQRFLDVMFTTYDKGNITFEQLSSSLGNVTALARSSGVSFEELNAAIAVQTKNGVPVSQSFTGLAQIMTKLAAPSDEVRKKLDALGVSYGANAIRAKGLDGVLKDLFEKSGGSAIVLKPILDDEGFRSALSLMGTDAGKDFSRQIGENMKPEGATKRAFDEMSKAMQQPFDELRVNLNEFFTGVGSSLAKELEPVAKWAADFTRKLAELNPQTKAQIGYMTALTAAGLGLAGAAIAIAPGINAMVNILSGASRFLPVVGTLFRGLAAAIAGLEVGPVLAVGAAVALVATAWREDWGQFATFTRETLARVASAASEVFGDVVRELKVVGRAIVQVVGDVGPTVREFISWLGSGFLGYVVDVLRSLSGAVAGAFRVVKLLIGDLWSVAKSAAAGVYEALKDLVEFLELLFRREWSQAFDFALQVADEWGDRLLATLKGLPARVGSAMSDIVSEMKSAWNEVLTGVNADTQNIVVPQYQRVIGNSINQAKAYVGKILKSGLGAVQEKSSSLLIGISGKDIAEAFTAESKRADAEAEALRKIQEAMHPRHDKPKSAGAAKARPLSNEEMLRAIRAGADTGSAELSGLDRPTLEATYRLVQNAVASNVRLAITSARRHNGGRSHHDHGRAIDVVAPGLSEDVAPGTIQRLADRTGFRSGINEYRSDVRAKTGGTGPHIHLATGLETMMGSFQLRGPSGKLTSATQGNGLMADLQKYVEKLIEFKQMVADFVAPVRSPFEKERIEVRKAYQKLIAEQKDLGISPEVQQDIIKASLAKMDEINAREKEATRKTQSELLGLRLEAEGKAGEAAKARIAEELASELDRLRQLRREYPALSKEIDATVESLQAASSRRLAAVDPLRALDRINDLGATREQMRSLGVASLQEVQAQFGSKEFARLFDQIPALKAEFQEAIQTVQAYFQSGAEGLTSEEQLERLRQALTLLQSLRNEASSNSQARQRQAEFELATGQMTREQFVQFQRAELDSYVANDQTKRDRIIQFADLYRQHLQQQLQLQGEFNVETLRQMEESLLQMGELTNSQTAELGALRQLIVDQEISDQQNRMQMLDQVAGGFQSFFVGVLSGQQSLNQGLSSLFKQLSSMILGEIAKWIAQALVFRLIMGAIGSLFGFGAAAGGGAASGGASIGQAAGIASYHDGGFVGRLQSDEIPAILLKGEYVLNRRQVAQVQGFKNASAFGSDSVGPQINPVVQFSGPITINNGMDAQQLGQMIGREIQRTAQGSY